MSRSLQPCRMSQRVAQAAACGMRTPAAVVRQAVVRQAVVRQAVVRQAADRHMVIGRVVAKPVVIERQAIGHSPMGGNDPMEVPDL